MKVDVRGHGDKAITIGYSGSRLDFWSLLAQAHDLDVAFADGGIVIDTPAEIEKLTRAAK
jgi:hypothetical protein